MNREMKNSNIPWIGYIPASWTTCHIKQIMRNKSIKGYPNETVLSLYREYGVVPKDSRTDNHNITSEDTSNYKFVEIGDFVINKMKAWQGSMAVSDYQGIISPAYYICRFTSNDIYKRYIHYLLRNETYKTEYMRLSSGLRVGQWDLNVEDFLRIPMVLPLYTEQKLIADFLDKKCEEIDELVALQEKIIEELKSYKQSVITETVCKGLNPNVPMKDSGIKWVGDIPEGWSVMRLKNKYLLRTGTTPDNFEDISEENVNWFTPSDIKEEGNVIYQSERKLSCRCIKENKIQLFPQGSLVFVGIGASAGKIGYAEVEGYSNQQITALIPQYGVCSKYFYYFMCADKKRLKDNAFYTTLPIINNSYLSQNKIIVPPLAEQEEIADYLDKKCLEIDQLISIKQQKIVELKDYKKSLIYENTTGKKEVKL